MGARFADLGSIRRAREEAFSDRLGAVDPTSAVAQFPTYAGEYWIARVLTLADLIRTVAAVPGPLAEVGYGSGADAVHLAKLRRVAVGGDPRAVYCFEDEPGPASSEAAARQVGDDLLDGDPHVVRHPGAAPDALRTALATEPGLAFSFVLLGVEGHLPMTIVLGLLHERVNPGGLVVVDDYGFDESGGTTLAVQEFLEGHGASYEVVHLRRTRQPSLLLRRT